MTEDLAERTQLLDVLTGEVLPATPENAHRVLAAVSERMDELQTIRAAATDYLREESRRVGTKTFHTPAGDVVLSGGPTTEYDPHDLAEALREAGCPEERIYNSADSDVDGVIQIEQRFSVRVTVLRQLVAANEDYRAAAELAERPKEQPWRAKAK